MNRYWINQPSTLQPLHNRHGILVIARKGYDGDRRDDTCTKVYFANGEVMSALIPTACLSEGWPDHLTNALPETEARLAEAVELLDELLSAMDAQREAPSLYGLRRQRKQDALESRYNANKREAAAEDAARAFLDKVKA